MIRIQQLHKSYGKLEILKGINLEVQGGQMLAIVGASGAGKTTLLQLVGALDKFEKGTIEVNGKQLGKLSRKQLAAYRNTDIGFIFQFHNLLPEFNATENVMLPALISGAEMLDAKAKAETLLEQLGLGHRLDHKPAELSGGEQQRVAVARALINSPKVLLADEPSGNLDKENAQQLHELIKGICKDRGLTSLVVTHNPSLAELADQTLTMRDGQLV